MKLVNLLPLKEIDFKNQDQFDDYQKQHKLRPDTKVTIAGKPTTAGQAAKNNEPTKGASVFGKTSDTSGVSDTPKDAKSKKAAFNQELKNMKNVKDFDALFTKMWNGDEDKLFMNLYHLVEDPKLQKAFFDAIKANLKKYPDGIV